MKIEYDESYSLISHLVVYNDEFYQFLLRMILHVNLTEANQITKVLLSIVCAKIIQEFYEY